MGVPLGCVYFCFSPFIPRLEVSGKVDFFLSEHYLYLRTVSQLFPKEIIEMTKKFLVALLISLITVMVSLSGAFAAKMVCLTNQDLRGETTIGNCLDQRMEFAILDPDGFVRILTPREVELTKKINPKALETKAFGLKYYHLAPEIPPLPVSPEVQ
jgi:hypothetical protein